MDLLSDILQDAGLRRRVLGLRAIPADVALRFPCDKSIGLHVAVQGPVHVHAPTLAEPLALATGDVAVMARGCDHALSVGPRLAGLRPQTITHELGPIEAGASVVVGGAYQLWNTPLHPFFAELPAWTVLRADARPRLGPLALAAGLVEQEIRSAEPGTHTIAQPIVDLTDQLSSLGGELLRHFAVTFDQRRNLVTFTREADGPVAMEPRRHTGLSFARSPAYWRVLTVIPDTPTAALPVQAGDLCVRINGEPVDKWDYARYAALLKTATKITCTFLAGTKETDIEVPIFNLVP